MEELLAESLDEIPTELLESTLRETSEEISSGFTEDLLVEHLE